GYDRYFHALSREISSRFGSRVQVVGVRNPGSTGNFEVRLKRENVATLLLHSKVTRGQGRCETEDEVDDVLDAIDEHLV
ncbi:seleno protein, partial [Pavlovales sp. CCMP2436]